MPIAPIIKEIIATKQSSDPDLDMQLWAAVNRHSWPLAHYDLHHFEGARRDGEPSTYLSSDVLKVIEWVRSETGIEIDAIDLSIDEDGLYAGLKGRAHGENFDEFAHFVQIQDPNFFPLAMTLAGAQLVDAVYEHRFGSPAL